MSTVGADYETADSLEIIEDIDMNENRIKELRNPPDANNASIKDI